MKNQRMRQELDACYPPPIGKVPQRAHPCGLELWLLERITGNNSSYSQNLAKKQMSHE